MINSNFKASSKAQINIRVKNINLQRQHTKRFQLPTFLVKLWALKVGRAQSAARKGTRGGSFRTAYQEEAWRRYNKRMQEEYEEELERVERIRRMQSVFNRERNKFRGGFENWKENDPNAHQYHQQYQRNDWYWKAESTFRNQRTNHQEPPKQSTRVYPLSHHYSVLGLSRYFGHQIFSSWCANYSILNMSIELSAGFLCSIGPGQLHTQKLRLRFLCVDSYSLYIQKAFREKAMEFHPDQNQVNKDVAEAKFKEVLLSYEAIKEERKDK
ncbi:hypothetical protein F2Q69_00002562 [Brassica cretica]|uniref:J domain-containing protein n=1 Tax=Brassica cretica TaxID=69181 RepID=A0A8S9P8Y8_BRACR|nr:hypothetical protein F2Q69_00002562 [Brassica cretica]